MSTMATNQNQNSSTITGDVKSRIDKIWDTLWAGGITVPVPVPSSNFCMVVKIMPPGMRSQMRYDGRKE